MSVVVFAYHDVGCRGIRVLRRLGVDIAAVYTHADDPTENTWFGSVRATAAELGVPVRVADPRTPEEIERLRAWSPRAIFSFYWRDMLPERVLSIASGGAYNLHGSLLPRYRGRAPVNWMILHGEREGGVTLHHMVRRADAGDIVDQEAFPIGPDDTPTDVYARLLPAAERVLERSVLAILDGTAPRWPQLESKATYHGRRTPDDGLIDWRQCAEDVRNLVRAVTRPYPGAFTFAGAARVNVWAARHDAPDVRAAAGVASGTVQRAGGDVFVVCGDRRRLRVDDVSVAGVEHVEAAFDLLRDGVVLSREGAKGEA